jgi:hypothetical protein
MISSESMHHPAFMVPPLPRPLLLSAVRVLIHAMCTVVCCETMSPALVLNHSFDYEQYAISTLEPVRSTRYYTMCPPG